MDTAETTGSTGTTETQTTTEAPKAGALGGAVQQQTQQTEQVQTEQATDTKTYARPEKFKTDADAWKSYAELETYKGKLEADIKSLREGKPQTPDKYDFEPLTKELGSSIINDDNRATFEQVLKDTGLSQEQLGKAAPAVKLLQESTAKAVLDHYHKEWADQFGGPVDTKAQTAQLQKDWGPHFDERFKIVGDFFAKQPPILTEYPESWTAEGWKQAYERIVSGRGPQLIRDTDTTAPDIGGMKAELAKMTNPRSGYGKNSPEGAKLRADAAALAERIAKAEGRM